MFNDFDMFEFLNSNVQDYCYERNLVYGPDVVFYFMLPDVMIPPGAELLPTHPPSLECGIHRITYGPSILIPVPDHKPYEGYQCSMVPAPLVVEGMKPPTIEEMVQMNRTFYITVSIKQNADLPNANDDKWLH